MSARRVGATLALLVVAGLFAFPFVWMALASLKANPEVFRPLPLLPRDPSLEAYRQLLDSSLIPFPRQLGNSLAVAATQTVLALALAVPAGFVLGCHRFSGRRAVLGMALLPALIPPSSLVLPQFSLLARLGLLDTLPAVILPGAVSGLGVLFFTLVFGRFPRDLIDAARSEGASEARVLLTLLPLVRPALLAFGFVHFVLAWQEHLLPLVALLSPERQTASVALAGLYGRGAQTPFAFLMVGGLLLVLPTAVLFLLASRSFRSSLADLVRP